MASVMRKGQLSVEFILIMLVLLLLINTVMQSNLLLAEEVLGDSQRMGEAVYAFDRIANAIEFLDHSAEGRQKLHLFLPKRSFLVCDPINNDLNILIETDQVPEKSREMGQCWSYQEKEFCGKSISLNAGLSCLNYAENDIGSYEGGRYINLQITKADTGDIEIREVS